MRVFISGKMTGLPDNGKKVFLEAENSLKWSLVKESESKVEIVNPINLIDNLSDVLKIPLELIPYELMFKYTTSELLKCNAIIFLNNWKQSKGARLEYRIAKNSGIKIYFADEEFKIKEETDENGIVHFNEINKEE